MIQTFIFLSESAMNCKSITKEMLDKAKFLMMIIYDELKWIFEEYKLKMEEKTSGGI